jgi:hypothetical protein
MELSMSTASRTRQITTVTPSRGIELEGTTASTTDSERVGKLDVPK